MIKHEHLWYIEMIYHIFLANPFVPKMFGSSQRHVFMGIVLFHVGVPYASWNGILAYIGPAMNGQPWGIFMHM